ADGKLLGSYSPQFTADVYGHLLSMSFGPVSTRSYFGNRPMSVQYGGTGTNYLTTGPDRLSSYGKFYPYGETKVAVPSPYIAMFATYTRDAATGLDYADQ